MFREESALMRILDVDLGFERLLILLFELLDFR
jgi:hypothetical protein